MRKREKFWEGVKRRIMAKCVKTTCSLHLKKDEYASLKLIYALTDIVRYNSECRNYLRDYGVESLIKELTREIPKLKSEESVLEYLRNWASDNKLADYNIQRYHIKDKVTILDHEFNGLEDIHSHCEMRAKEYLSGLECWSLGEVLEYPDIHIGEIYDNYPIFDSFDLNDNRTYRNYIFRTLPITEKDMQDVFTTSHQVNFCMVHEYIKKEYLPILYYSGDGEYMLLATER